MKQLILFFIILSLVGFAGIIINSCCKSDNTVPSLPSDALVAHGWAVGGDIGHYGTILHTMDGGKTWIQQGDSLQFSIGSFSDVCIINKSTLLVVGGNPNGNYNVFKSVNGGNTWTLSGSGALENLSYTGIFALDENNIWIVGEKGSIYYSTDAADTWTKLEVPVEYQEDNFERIAAKSKDDIWVVGDKHVNDDFPIMLHTTNGGTNWERLNPLENMNIQGVDHFLGIKLFGNSVWAIGGSGQFVIQSADNGTTWEDITGGERMGDANDIFPLSETEAYVVKDYGQIYSTNDTGTHWTQYYPHTNNWLVGIAILNNVNIWICGEPGGLGEYSEIKYSSDAGTTWQEQTPQLIINNDVIELYKIRFIGVD